jgi:hypothetical protein
MFPSMRVVLGVLLGVAFIGLMAYAVLQETQVSCEVCLDYRGNSACRTSSAIDRNAAIQGAIHNACAILSSGVTDGIDCNATRPRSVQCDD